MITYEHICEGTKCKFYTVWDFGYEDCYSCVKIGQSYNVDEYPDDCPHITEMKKYKSSKGPASTRKKYGIK